MSENNDMISGSELEEYEHFINPKYKATLAVIFGIIGTIVLAWVLGVILDPVMDFIQPTPLYHLIPFLLSISFFAVLIHKAYVQEIRGLNFLASAVLLFSIQELIFTIFTIEGTIFNRGDNVIVAIADLLVPISVILLYLHIELMEKQRPDLKHAIGIIGTAIPIVIGGLILIITRPIDIDLVEEIRSEVRDVVFVYLGFFALVVLWISIFGFRVMYRTLKHADTPPIALSSLFVLIGFSSLLTNFVLLGVNYSSIIIDRPIIYQAQEFTIHNAWILTLALMSLLFAYIINPQFAYAVPFDVYQLIIINQYQGITLYSFINEFRQEGKLTHDALKSPAIVAIQNLVEEISHTEGHIILIGMSDRIIIMKNHKEIVSVLITEKNSYFLNKGLEDFTVAFYDRYEEHIVNFKGNVKVFRDANMLIRKHLPFMRDESLLNP